MVVHADAFQAVADPPRRQIIAVLGAGERQVNDVVAAPAHPARGGLRAGTKVAATYGDHMLVELFPEGAKVRIVITVDAHRDSEWTERATAGMTSQLRKLPAAFARRRA